MDNHGKNVGFASWSYADRMLSTGADSIACIKSKQCSLYMMSQKEGDSREVNFHQNLKSTKIMCGNRNGDL